MSVPMDTVGSASFGGQRTMRQIEEEADEITDQVCCDRAILLRGIAINLDLINGCFLRLPHS
jgi:hypothetical protein